MTRGQFAPDTDASLFPWPRLRKCLCPASIIKIRLEASARDRKEPGSLIDSGTTVPPSYLQASRWQKVNFKPLYLGSVTVPEAVP